MEELNECTFIPLTNEQKRRANPEKGDMTMPGSLGTSQSGLRQILANLDNNNTPGNVSERCGPQDITVVDNYDNQHFDVIT